MPRVPGDVPQVSFQPTQMPGFTAPAVQPAQNFGPQQIQQLAGALQDAGQASSRIGASMQRKGEEQAEALARQKDKLNDSITTEKLIQYRVEAGQYARDFFKQEGVSARDGFQKYMEGFDEINKKYDEYFQDPIQKKLWQNKATLYREEWRYDMATHAQEQSKIVDRENLTGSKDLSRQDYARSVTRNATAKIDPLAPDYMDKFIAPAAHKAVIIDAVKRLNSDKDAKFVQSKIKEELESLHKETIGGMMGVVQPKRIMSYLEENKGEVSPDFYASTKTELQRTDRVSNAKAEAVAIYSQLPAREVNGVRVVDEDAIAVFVNKAREERAKKIADGKAVDESYYDTRDSYLAEMARKDGRIVTTEKANLVNAYQQAFFEMSSSDYQSYDPTLDHGNALQKLEDKFPEIYKRLKDIGELGSVVEYARNTNFGAKSDPDTLALAKAYVDENGKTADLNEFASLFGSGLSKNDMRRLSTDINIAQNKADQRSIEDGQAMRSIERLLDGVGITKNREYNTDNTFELTKEQAASVERHLKDEWDSIVIKGFENGVTKAKAFDDWIKQKETDLIANRGRTPEMLREERKNISKPVYYTSPTSKRTYNLDSVDKTNIELASVVLSEQNKNRFYFTYSANGGESQTIDRSFGNAADRDSYMRRFKASNPNVSVVPQERPYKPVFDNDPELRKLAIEIAENFKRDPDVGNRIDAIQKYHRDYEGLGKGQASTELKVLRQSLIKGDYNPNQTVGKEMAMMLTGLSEGDLDIYGIKEVPEFDVLKRVPSTKYNTNKYRLSDIEKAFTNSFRQAMAEYESK